MKKVLFASSALAALAIGGAASAQGISLFGSARLGLGYGIQNDGALLLDEDGEASDDLRAVSRVRFGVNMTGETNSGITFGATIRADNAIGGEGDATADRDGMRSGEVFVSGSFGTLTYGDTNAADEQWVGDLIGDYSLTGLGELDETAFISNGGGFGNDNTNDFFSNANARPTVRYDFEIAGFGLSVSANRDLDSYGVGGGYAGNFGAGTFNVGLGYYDYEEFETTLDDPLTPDFDEGLVPGGKQYSAVVGGTFGDYGANVIYNDADSDGASFKTLGAGLSAGFGDFTLGAWYRQVIDADGGLEDVDGSDAYALTGEYDLGGGATVNGGVQRNYDFLTSNDDDAITADFGISMAF